MVCTIPAVDVQGGEERGGGRSGEEFEPTLSVPDSSHTQGIDQQVEPIHQNVPEQRPLPTHRHYRGLRNTIM